MSMAGKTALGPWLGPFMPAGLGAGAAVAEPAAPARPMFVHYRGRVFSDLEGHAVEGLEEVGGQMGGWVLNGHAGASGWVGPPRVQRDKASSGSRLLHSCCPPCSRLRAAPRLLLAPVGAQPQPGLTAAPVQVELEPPNMSPVATSALPAIRKDRSKVGPPAQGLLRDCLGAVHGPCLVQHSTLLGAHARPQLLSARSPALAGLRCLPHPAQRCCHAARCLPHLAQR